MVAYPALYALLPFAIAFDIVTSPIQVPVFLFVPGVAFPVARPPKPVKPRHRRIRSSTLARAPQPLLPAWRLLSRREAAAPRRPLGEAFESFRRCSRRWKTDNV